MSLRWPDGATGGGGSDGGGGYHRDTLPPTGADGDIVFLSGDDAMWVWEGGTSNRVSPGPAGGSGPAGPQGAPGRRVPRAQKGTW